MEDYIWRCLNDLVYFLYHWNLIGIYLIPYTGVGMAYGIEKMRIPHWITSLLNHWIIDCFLRSISVCTSGLYTSENTAHIVDLVWFYVELDY